MASLVASYATSKVSSLAADELNKGKQVATADLEKVKGDTINALKQLQGSCYYYTLLPSGQAGWVKNENYKDIPELRLG